MLTLEEIKHYKSTVIPNLENRLLDDSISDSERLELYNLYLEILRIVAHDDFDIFNQYLEIDENHNDNTKAFHYHRKNHLNVIVDAMNEMEVEDKYDMVLISMPPRVGKTTYNIRFQAFVMGRHPEDTELVISYSDSITTSFYNGIVEILQSPRFREVFPDCPIVNQNAKQESIWLKQMKRYPTITFVPIGGSLTGRCEAGRYLFCDDLCSGLEESMSATRMEKLWGLYTVNAKQRKLDGAKELHIATKWSLHDPMSKLTYENQDNPRCKIINLPCFDEQGESNFNFDGGFSTKYYEDMRKGMDEVSFNALYLCEPIERNGLLYHKEDLMYYFELPDEKPDSIVAICDSKNMGKDYVASPVGYIYGDLVYIDDVVYNNGLPEVTRELVSSKWVEHNVVRADIEMNNGGNYYAEDIDELIHEKGGKTSIRMFFTGNNKQVKIITYSDYVKKHFVFKDKSKYSPNGEYAKFMKDLLSWTQTGNNKNDDAPDSIAMLAQLVQELEGNAIKFINRRALNI